MSIFKLLALACCVAGALSAPHLDARCPGNTESLTLRVVKSTLIVVSVRVNQNGPYDFLVDTGAQVSSIDTELASALHLKPEGVAGVGGAATFNHAYVVHIDLEAGSKAVASSTAVVVDKSQLQAVDPQIRGILGGAFLQHFDFLIDNEKRLLCLDDSGLLAATVKGVRVVLQQPHGAQKDLPFTRPLVVTAQLSEFKDQPMLLRLDSGTNVPLLYADSARHRPSPLRPTLTLKRVVNGAEQDFSILPPQIVTIGPTILEKVPFAVPTNSVGAGGPAPREDGILPTFAYRRVFISCSGNYAILDRWPQ